MSLYQTFVSVSKKYAITKIVAGRKMFTSGCSHKFQGKVNFQTFVIVTKKYATTKIVAKI